MCQCIQDMYQQCIPTSRHQSTCTITSVPNIYNTTLNHKDNPQVYVSFHKDVYQSTTITIIINIYQHHQLYASTMYLACTSTNMSIYSISRLQQYITLSSTIVPTMHELITKQIPLTIHLKIYQ
jgi:hypothetical protein